MAPYVSVCGSMSARPTKFFWMTSSASQKRLKSAGALGGSARDRARRVDWAPGAGVALSRLAADRPSAPAAPLEPMAMTINEDKSRAGARRREVGARGVHGAMAAAEEDRAGRQGVGSEIVNGLVGS